MTRRRLVLALLVLAAACGSAQVAPENRTRTRSDLLTLEVEAGKWLPLDTKSANFDNIADAQTPSATLLDGYLDAAVPPPAGDIHAVIAPHAGIMFSGPVAACAYKAVAAQAYDVAVLVGPSHFVGFDGVALYPEGAFATPFAFRPTAATSFPDTAPPSFLTP